MKTCRKCARALPLSEFYPHPRMADGHLNKCKACARLDVRTNYAGRVEQYREYHRTREATPRRQEWRRTNPPPATKRRARWLVANAVRRGKLTRQPCEVCGQTRTDAHHLDYSQPLTVRWLCRQHHMEAHHAPEVTPS